MRNKVIFLLTWVSAIILPNKMENVTVAGWLTVDLTTLPESAGGAGCKLCQIAFVEGKIKGSEPDLSYLLFLWSSC